MDLDRRVRLLAAAAVAGLTVLAAAPRPAAAYEHQYHLGADVGYVGLLGKNGASGFGTRIHFDYGLSDALNLMTRVEVVSYPSTGVFVPSAAVGIGYVVDVLQWVPYIGAMAGFADVAFPGCTTGSLVPCHQPKLALEIPAGIDYLVTRRVAIGAAGRFQLLVLNGSTVTTAGGFLRGEYIWGF